MRELTPFIFFLSPDIHFSHRVGHQPSTGTGATSATRRGLLKVDWTNSDPGISDVSAKQANELTQSRNAAPTAVILDETSGIGLL